MPPSRNGLADYTYGLLPTLSDYYEPIVVVSDDAPTPERSFAEILYESEYRGFNLAHERHLYLLGNNSGLHYVLPHLAITPGIVNVHDMTLHGMLEEATGAAFSELVRTVHGSQGAAVLDVSRRYQALNEHRHSSLSLLPMISRWANGMVVHSNFARVRAVTQGVTCPVYVIPCFCPAPLAVSKKKSRQGQFIELLCLGFVGKTKKIDLVLRAVKILAGMGLPVRLTIAGEPRPDEYDLHSDISRLGLSDYCLLKDYLDEAAMSDELANADMLVNLRFPTHGESSGPLLRAMWLGTCAVVTDIGSFSEFPDDAVIKVSIEEMSAQGIADRLLPYILRGDLRKEKGAKAAEYAHKYLSAKVATEQYRTVIEETDARVRQSSEKGAKRARLRLRLTPTNAIRPQIDDRCWAEKSKAWWRASSLPLPGAGDSLLIVGGDDDDVMTAEKLGWRRVVVWPINDEHAKVTGVLVLVTPRGYRNCRRLMESLGVYLSRTSFVHFCVAGLTPDEQQEVRAAVESEGFQFVNGGRFHREVFICDEAEKAEDRLAEFDALAVRAG